MGRDERMDQNKTGKFIQELRKQKKMTQQELAEKLGVSDKTIGNWENGRNMPDLSVFKPLCDALDITINELMSGERISEDRYQEKFEENIVKTIDYSAKKVSKYNNVLGHLLVVFGLFISMSAIMIFPSENNLGATYAFLGIIIFTAGIFQISHRMKFWKRFFLIVVIFLCSINSMLLNDYISVKINGIAPTFRFSSTDIEEDITYYNAPLYNVIKCGNKYNVVKNKKYTNDEVLEYCIKINKKE